MSHDSNYYDHESFQAQINSYKLTSSNFSLLHVNARSLQKNINRIEHELNCLPVKFSVIGVSESWLNPSNAELYCFAGYSSTKLYRETRKGGGVSLFIKDSLHYVSRKDLNVFNADIEAVFIEIDKNLISTKKNIVVGCVYRPPDHSISNFSDSIDDILKTIEDEHKECYLLGDYNIDLLNMNKHKSTADFLENMYSHSCIPLIKKPTRISRHRATLIDNIFTSRIEDINSVQGILWTDVSDHLPVFVIHKNECVSDCDKFIFKRSFSDRNIVNFRDVIANTDWQSLVMHLDEAQSAYSAFHNYISKTFDSCFPIVKVKVGYKTRKAWLTSGLRKSISIKNKLYIKSVKIPTDYNVMKYKVYKFKLNKLLNCCERKHYEQLLVRYQNDLSRSWGVIKDIINKNKKNTSLPPEFDIQGQKISDKQAIASAFNRFYLNVGESLASNSPVHNISPLSYMKNRNPNSMFLESVVEPEIEKIIVNLKISSPGWDNIPAKIIKSCYGYLLTPLCYTFNLSLTQGVFPHELKRARVVPIHKGNSVSEVGNYRPVSVLPIFSKILERIMYNRLLSFINRHDILYKFQFGFREKYSTNLALITLIDKIASALNNGDTVLGVFLDFSKAFDCVNHSILLEKLEFYGIRGVSYDWFASYLSNREQYVCYDGVSSEYGNISCGVPQGSILGPILFLLYINDIVNVSSTLFLILFADDTNAFISGKNITEIFTKMNSELRKLVIWLDVNKLRLNAKKTHFILFSPSKTHVPDDCKLYISDDEIHQVSHTKFLGVMIDSKLNWDFHINYIKGKISKAVGILSKARKFISSPYLITLYYAFLYPYLNYCIEVWGGAATTRMDSLIKLQKKAVRIITSSGYRDHTAPLFLRLKILNLEKLYILKILTFMYKFHHNILPPVLENVFVRNNANHNYDTRKGSLFKIFKSEKNCLSQSIKVKGVLWWNKIFQKIDADCSISVFKKRAKQFIADLPPKDENYYRLLSQEYES